MVTDRELVEKWRTQVFKPAANEVNRFLEGFPNRRALTIPFERVGADYRFSEPLFEEPDRTLEAGRRALSEVATELGDDVVGVHPDDRVYLRVTDPPLERRQPIGALRTDVCNQVIRVDGIVVDVGEVRPRAIVADYRCVRCEHHECVRQPGRYRREPARCSSCNAAGPFTLTPERATCVDSQHIRLRGGQRDGGAGGGQTAEEGRASCLGTDVRGAGSDSRTHTGGNDSVDVALEHDLVGRLEPGDPCSLTVIPRVRFDDDTTTGTIELEAVSATTSDTGRELEQ